MNSNMSIVNNASGRVKIASISKINCDIDINLMNNNNIRITSMRSSHSSMREYYQYQVQ